MCQPEWQIIVVERLGEGKNTLAGGTDGHKGNNARRKQLAQAEV